MTPSKVGKGSLRMRCPPQSAAARELPRLQKKTMRWTPARAPARQRRPLLRLHPRPRLRATERCPQPCRSQLRPRILPFGNRRAQQKGLCSRSRLQTIREEPLRYRHKAQRLRASRRLRRTGGLSWSARAPIIGAASSPASAFRVSCRCSIRALSYLRISWMPTALHSTKISLGCGAPASGSTTAGILPLPLLSSMPARSEARV
jgi:hypothetical protein